jgi:O-6-methylguanine DNA methyltransferase
MIYYSYFETKIGRFLTTANQREVIGLYMTPQKLLPQIHKDWHRKDDIEIFIEVKRQLSEYLEGKRKKFDIDYQLVQGTYLQKETWRCLAQIPYGETITYQDLVGLTSYPSAVRAVASAVGKNPLLILLPCHRVVRSDGSVSGYAAGVNVKRLLLTLEENKLPTQKGAI